MKQLIAVILVVFVCIVSLACGAERDPVGEWEGRMPGALDGITETYSDIGDFSYYRDRRTDDLSGDYFYPFIIKHETDVSLNIFFNTEIEADSTQLEIVNYVVDTGENSYLIDPLEGEGHLEDGYNSKFLTRPATDTDIEMLKMMAMAPETTIAYTTGNSEYKRTMSEQERLIILSILSAYEQMTRITAE